MQPSQQSAHFPPSATGYFVTTELFLRQAAGAGNASGTAHSSNVARFLAVVLAITFITLSARNALSLSVAWTPPGLPLLQYPAQTSLSLESLPSSTR